ncbi:MAG: hypothetical protein MI924_27880, partial [Chloroflexales bacterium]|nr:hypothetical protein [Chloroflexales bacterium]
MTFQIFIWWLVSQSFGLVGLLFANVIFRSLPDRGYAFTKPLGLLLVGYASWLLAMVGLGSFGTPLIIVVTLIIVSLGVWLRGGLRQILEETRA